MPSREHELSIELLSRKPALLARSLRRKKVRFPECVLLPETEAVRWQTTRVADLVLVGRVGGVPVLACIVEVQRTRDAEKRLAWPWYCGGMHAVLACPTYVIVIALDDDVARWARTPIDTFQPGSRWAPIVIGAGDLPVLTDDVAIAREPELAVLSALAAARGPDAAERVGFVLRVLSDAEHDHCGSAREADRERECPEGTDGSGPCSEPIDLALAFASTAVDILNEDEWKRAREIMEARTRGDGRPNPLAEYFENRGLERGERRVLLKLLTLRFGAPSESVVARIAAADAETLERWAERVLTATTLEGVLDD